MHEFCTLSNHFIQFIVLPDFGPISSENCRTFCFSNTVICGPGSSIGVATDNGLDGPESNPGWDEIIRPSRPTLGPTQPPVKWVPGLSRE